MGAERKLLQDTSILMTTSEITLSWPTLINFHRPCKSRKVKCDEAHPACLNCQRQGELCDYSIRLNWEGRGKKKTELLEGTGQINFSSNATAETRPKSSQGIWSEEQRPVTSSSSYTEPRSMIDPRIPTPSTTADPPESYSSNNRDHKRRLILPASSQGRVTQPAMNLVRTGLSSPSDLNYGSPNNLSFASLTLPASQNAVVPTQPIYGKMFEEDHSAFERRSKRTRYEYASDCIKPVREYEMPPPYGPFAYGGSNTSSPASAFMFSSGHPSIPTAPSTPSDDAYKSNVNKLSPFATQESSDPRRLSVESLLSGPPGMGSDSTMTNNRGSISDIQSPLTSLDQEELTTWGIDRGFKDLDMPKNDDLNAISGGSPAIRREEPEWFANAHDEYSPIEFGFGVQAKDTAFEGGGYYAQ
ncbi:MAG: hypothetical protein M1818_001217 [Claussenomyces sp. TS43310]|nr:MAG: hypothetical protein M1818_001217 [Claussenomyces sp. TS43310]